VCGEEIVRHNRIPLDQEPYRWRKHMVVTNRWGSNFGHKCHICFVMSLSPAETAFLKQLQQDSERVGRTRRTSGHQWTWLKEYRRQWMAEPEYFLKFYAHWRDRSHGSAILDVFPYALSHGLDLGEVAPFARNAAPIRQILVTEAYNNMFHRLLSHRLSSDTGESKGAVLLGQPGIGASPRCRPM